MLGLRVLVGIAVTLVLEEPNAAEDKLFTDVARYASFYEFQPISSLPTHQTKDRPKGGLRRLNSPRVTV
jgi:hypothetical protein